MRKTVINKLWLLAIGAMLATGCSSEDADPTLEPTVSVEDEPAELIEQKSPYILEALSDFFDLKNTEHHWELEAQANRYNEFLLDLLNRVPGSMDSDCANFAVSPLSIAMTASLVANASDDATSKTIYKRLGFPSLEEMNLFNNRLIRYLQSSNIGKIDVANSIWFDNSLIQLPQDFVSTLEQAYSAETFGGNGSDPDVFAKMNRWVSEKTCGQIAELFPGGQSPLGAGTYMTTSFINALFLSALWTHPFDENDTEPATFHGTNGDTEVQMMCLSPDKLPCVYETEHYTGVFLHAGSIIVTFLLPTEGNTPADVIANVPGLYSLKADDATNSSVKIPRFSIKSNFEIADLLENVGISLDKATLDKIGYNGKTDIATGHSTSISVHEKGLEIGAASYALYGGCVIPPLDNRHYVFDRPFAFTITEMETGAILMAGCVNNL